MTTPEEAAENLAQIRRVIERSRAERARSGDIYVVWGVIIIVADLCATFGPRFGFEMGWIAFPLLSPVGAVYSAVSGLRNDARMSTFGTRIEARLWILAMLVMGVLTFAGVYGELFGLRAIVPLISCVLAMAVGTSGTVFASRMFTVAGFGFVVVGAITVLLPLEAQHLLFVVALALGYVLPGLSLMRDERAGRANRGG